jgi:hypothetical protein
MALQFSVSMFAMIWSAYTYDVAKLFYFWESGPGLALLGVRVFTAVWFARCAASTSRNFAKKRGFYGKFNKFFFVYLMVIPIMIGIASGVDAYYRFMLVRGVELFTQWFGQALLLALYNPSTQFNRSFPFHSQTASMIGMYGKSEGNTPGSTLMQSSSRQQRLQE